MNQTSDKRTGRSVLTLVIPAHGLMDLLVAAAAGSVVGVRLTADDNHGIMIGPDGLPEASRNVPHIPDSALVAGVYTSPGRNAVMVNLVHDDFMEVPDGEHPPELRANIVWIPATGGAMAVLAREIASDYVFHCTWMDIIALAAEQEGVEPDAARKIAERVLTKLSTPKQAE